MLMLAALAFVAPAARPATRTPPAPATLWTSGNGFPCYRQPVVVSGGGSRLLAFVEGRFSSPCAPALPLGTEAEHPSEVGGLNLRISEDGQSWGPSKIIYGNATKEGPNMDYFSVVRHTETNTIHLFLAVKGILHFTSQDGGDSWQGPTALTGPAPWPHAPTVGHAVELSSGSLVVPACCSTGSCALISKDAGKSWTVGGFGVHGSRESSIAEVSCDMLLQSGSAAESGVAPAPCLYVNARNMNKKTGDAPHGRFEASSTDGGLTWTNMTLSTRLTTPVTVHWTGIVANVVALPTAASSSAYGGPLVYAGASAATARARMALSISSSTSSGQSGGQAIKWSPPKTIWPGPAGYADIVALNSTHVGVLYEAGDTTFADRIQFSIVPTSFFA